MKIVDDLKPLNLSMEKIATVINEQYGYTVNRTTLQGIMRNRKKIENTPATFINSRKLPYSLKCEFEKQEWSII